MMKVSIIPKKIKFFLLIIFCLYNHISFAQDVECVTSLGIHFDWWESLRYGEKGLQLYVPLKIDFYYNNFSANFLSGYAYTVYDPVGQEHISLSDLLDTKLNFSYKLPEKLPFSILLGVDFNLPTGRTRLSSEKLNVIMDPDLVSITSFGEGFNVNPNIAIVKEFGKVWLSAGFGYVWRGEYDYSNELIDYEPGGIWLFTSKLDFELNMQWHLWLINKYCWYGKDKLQGQDFYQEGDFVLFGAGIKYIKWPFEAKFGFEGIWRGKSKFPEDGYKLNLEDRNSHGDEWIYNLGINYWINSKTSINGSIQFLWIDENDYEKTSAYYLGERRKITFGLGLLRELNANIMTKIYVKWFTMHEQETWYHPDEERDYRGFSVDISLITKF